MWNELADMYKYGAARRKMSLSQATVYIEVPNRRVPQHQMFSCIHRQLCETASFAATNVNRGRGRLARTLAVEEAVLQEIDE